MNDPYGRTNLSVQVLERKRESAGRECCRAGIGLSNRLF